MSDPMQDERARLAPVLFLEGAWRGEGRGPFGPYRLEARIARRGRWLLMTSEIFDAKSDQITYVSTQVYGYDDDGLRLSFFDTAGSFDFRGTPTGDGLRFDWREGENWKRSQYWREAEGKIRFRYESVFPKGSAEVFEGIWLPLEAPCP